MYLLSNGTISKTKPTDEIEKRCLISDPLNPIPYTQRPIFDFWDNSKRSSTNWRLQDQRIFLTNSTMNYSILVWESEPLKQDMIVTGNIIGNIIGDSNCTDTDCIIKLIDVFPDGFQFMIADRELRGKFRESLSNPIPIEIGKETNFTINMLGRDHCFKEGHKIMVHIQSSYFPLISINQNEYNPSNETDFKIAMNCVYQSSSIELPILYN